MLGNDWSDQGCLSLIFGNHLMCRKETDLMAFVNSEDSAQPGQLSSKIECLLTSNVFNKANSNDLLFAILFT